MQSSIQCQKDYMVERYLNNSLISHITFKNKVVTVSQYDWETVTEWCQMIPVFFFFFKNDPANQKSEPTVCGAHPYAKAQNILYLKCAL